MNEGPEACFTSCTHPHAASCRRAAWTARLVPVAATDTQDKTDKRRAKISMSLVPVERARFGTQIRCASHCGTTPLQFCLRLGDDSPLEEKWVPATRFDVLLRAYKL